MTIKYVIRQNDFAYNDEWYQTHQAVAGSIQAIYIDQAEAIQTYKQLVVDALYEDGELCNYDIGNGYASDETYEKLEQFVLEKTGEEFEIDDEIPEMELDDAFEFAQISGVLHYQLIEIDQQKPIYILWSNEEQSYLTNYDFNTVFDSQNENFDDLNFDQLYPVIEEHFEEQIFNKNLNDISDSPALFKNLIQNITAITYSTNENSITEADWDELTFIQLKSMNALLKQPFFEIRQITLEQLNKITNGEENE
ncbi:hypothetical protein [Acinetobacter sp. Marseille-Q1618]|uniref:hypothetical protein n=1 Tax=Acinetobacter sp. Marseille-Q1618 TaxID=2697502 RepID=UPI001570642F|nr:hypothetical protein [Acinetobacter sp. Marseille-Q1618]